MVGMVLGNAFDQAIGLTLRHWRIVLVAWIVMGAAYVFDRTPNQSIVDLLSTGLAPIVGILAARSKSTEFTFRASSLLRFYLVSIIWVFVTVGLPAILLAIFIPSLLHARETGDTGIGPYAGMVLLIGGAAALFVWIGTKWSLAWVIAFYRSRPVLASLRESWTLTSGMFWQTLLLNISVTVAYVIVWLGPVFLVAVALEIAYANDPAKIGSAMPYVMALFMPLLVYGGIAEWIAYIIWLERLDPPRTAVAAADESEGKGT